MAKTNKLDARAERLIAKLKNSGQRWRRSDRLLPGRLIDYHKDELRAVQYTQRWAAVLRDDELVPRAEKRLLARLGGKVAARAQRIEKRIERLRPFTRVETGPRPDVTLAVIAVAQCLFPKGMKRGQRMPGAGRIANVLNDADARNKKGWPFTTNTVYLALYNYHNRRQGHWLRVSAKYEPFAK